MKPQTILFAGLIAASFSGCISSRMNRDNNIPAEVKTTPMVGDLVRGSDHGKIGYVKKIVTATDTTAGYLLVRRNDGISDRFLEFVQHLRFWKSGYERKVFIPLQAVVKRDGRTVFINVPAHAGQTGSSSLLVEV